MLKSKVLYLGFRNFLAYINESYIRTLYYIQELKIKVDLIYIFSHMYLR